MNEFSVSMNLLGAGIGSLIAVYVVLGVILVLGAVAIFRLSVLAKKAKEWRGGGQQPKDCDSCEKLKEKEKQVAALTAALAADEQKIEDQQREIDDLKRILAEKQAEPKVVIVSAPETAPEPAPEPHITVIPEETRTLAESLAEASATGVKDLITKQTIIEYLSNKYGEAVEINARPKRTPNGKLLLSDNHFAFTPKGKRVCFTYVYETDEGQVLALIKSDDPYMESLVEKHPGIRHSAFPKNKDRDWYSVVEDATFTETEFFAVFDHAIELIRGKDAAVVSEPETAPEEEEVSLSESLAAAKETGAVGIVTKQSIIDHLEERFGQKVELNGRANHTPNGRLLMSDNHFAFTPHGKRVCFAYVYQDDDGKIMILLRTTEEQAHEIHSAHSATGFKSAFPKNKDRDWYSVVVDGTFTTNEVYEILDRAALNIIGVEEKAPAPAPAPEVVPEVSLSESLAAAKETGAVGIVTKASVLDHLAEKFGNKVELNSRANRTPNGKLLMSDNHFAFTKGGKRVCFTYVYQDDDGKVIILLRTTMEHAQEIRSAHKATGVRSAFPKNKDKDWYSVVIDGTFTEKDVFDLLDRAAQHIIDKDAEAAVAATTEDEVSLKESLAAAKETGAVGVVTKKSVIDRLLVKHAEKVEVNGRANRTPNGKLLLSDNHFAVAGGKRVCFTYVYEDEGKVVILVRLPEDVAAALHVKHHGTCVKSAFPKNKDKDWYSVVVDASFTDEDVFTILDAGYNYVLTK